MLQTIVPCRSGSKGVPNKNLMEVGGKPLFIRAVMHALEVPDSILKPIVSSDDDVYLRSLVDYFSEDSKLASSRGEFIEFDRFFFHRRPKHLARDDSKTGALVNYLLSKKISPRSQPRPKNVLILQPSSPFRTKNELAIELMNLISSLDGTTPLVSLKRVEEGHPARMYEFHNGNKMTGIRGFDQLRTSRRQDLPNVYLRDGGYYVFPVQKLGHVDVNLDTVDPMVREDFVTINIDAQQDLDFARFLVETGNSPDDVCDVRTH